MLSGARTTGQLDALEGGEGVERKEAHVAHHGRRVRARCGTCASLTDIVVLREEKGAEGGTRRGEGRRRDGQRRFRGDTRVDCLANAARSTPPSERLSRHTKRDLPSRREQGRGGGVETHLVTGRPLPALLPPLLDRLTVRRGRCRRRRRRLLLRRLLAPAVRRVDADVARQLVRSGEALLAAVGRRTWKWVSSVCTRAG